MSLCGTNKQQQLKIELLSQWKLEAESRKFLSFYTNAVSAVSGVSDKYEVCLLPG